MKGKTRIILKISVFSLLALLAAVFLTRMIGMAVHRATPKGGINESMYVQINGTKQWIHIYGKDRQNPVLLYLHGGPGSATSDVDYAFTRKWADVYTVVTWDQRNCGKSYSPEQNDTKLTYELLMDDGRQITEFILSYLSKEKLTVLGHSWGSIYGANLVLEYPQYYNCFIGTGQLVDAVENEEAFVQQATLWADGDAEALRLIGKLTPNAMTRDHIAARNQLMDRYGYGRLAGGTDYNVTVTKFFNPHYSAADWFCRRDMKIYLDFLQSEEFAKFSLKGRTDYQVPYYNINGDRDYQTNYQLAEAYFHQVNAPYKQLFLMENMTHGLLESRSEEFSQLIHIIAKQQNGV